MTNYVRQTWANGAPATAEAGLVAKARGNTETLMSAGRNDACPKMKAPTIAKALGAERNAIDQHLIRMTDQNMPRTAEQVVAALRAAPPRAANADVINGLAHAYCSVLSRSKTTEPSEKSLQLGRFSQLAFMAADGQKLR